MTDDQQFNDGACDPAGRFWAGHHLDRPAAGRVGAVPAGRRRPDHPHARPAVTESNGIGWSPDGSTMYYIDSGEKPRRVRAFDYDVISGTIGGERELICYPAEDEYPDGLVVDADGHLWIAFWGGGQVRRYDPAGGLVEVVELPVSLPDLRRLRRAGPGRAVRDQRVGRTGRRAAGGRAAGRARAADHDGGARAAGHRVPRVERALGSGAD